MASRRLRVPGQHCPVVMSSSRMARTDGYDQGWGREPVRTATLTPPTFEKGRGGFAASPFHDSAVDDHLARQAGRTSCGQPELVSLGARHDEHQANAGIVVAYVQLRRAALSHQR
jgi:hypothetical protein